MSVSLVIHQVTFILGNLKVNLFFSKPVIYVSCIGRPFLGDIKKTCLCEWGCSWWFGSMYFHWYHFQVFPLSFNKSLDEWMKPLMKIQSHISLPHSIGNHQLHFPPATSASKIVQSYNYWQYYHSLILKLVLKHFLH